MSPKAARFFQTSPLMKICWCRWSVQDRGRPRASIVYFRVCRSAGQAGRNGKRRAGENCRSEFGVSASLTGVFRIESVLGAHLIDDRDVFAAGDQPHHGRRYVPAAQMGFDDIGLTTAIGGVGTLGV